MRRLFHVVHLRTLRSQAGLKWQGLFIRSSSFGKGPLYVKSFNTLEGSSLASAAGALIGNAAANSSRNGSEWRELTREGARLGSDLVENRKKNGQCQYLLETDDEYLIQRVNPRYIIDDGRPDADQLQLQSRIASTEQEIQILERQLNEAIFKLNEDRENRELAGLATAIDSLVSEKIEILGLMDARIQKQNEPKKHEAVITVFNPCRDFEVGENVLVMDAGFGNIILEKNEIGL